jgi:molybdopterin-binding protein
MEQSIRNQLPDKIKSIVSDKVLSEVIVETSIGDVASVITTRSVEEMKLKAGDEVLSSSKRPTSPCAGVARHTPTSS